MNQQLIECFKALGDPIRFNIYNSLKKQRLCACEFSEVLELDISQPTLSFHLRKLKECGLIDETREGNRKMMSINEDMLNQMKIYWER